jgi:Fe-S cluster assembly protein SufD
MGPVAIGTGHPLGRLAGKQGWSLRLGPDQAPEGLVQVIHVSTAAADHLAAEIVLADGAQASVVETYLGDGWTNRLTDIRLGRNARLMLSRRILGETGFVSLTDQAVLGEGASLVAATLAVGRRDTRLDGEIELAGTGAYAEAAGALLARGRQRHDANLVVRHLMPDGTSRQIWRSVADDRATCSVAARVEVARDAQKTDGEQSLKGLLLARSAVINAKPELEIFADDVKCAHGATVGELDRNALFYLESRGVGPEEARGLLTRAFVADALDRIGEEAVKSAFYKDAEGWFA